jgi:hypothetical protein
MGCRECSSNCHGEDFWGGIQVTHVGLSLSDICNYSGARSISFILSFKLPVTIKLSNTMPPKENGICTQAHQGLSGSA